MAILMGSLTLGDFPNTGQGLSNFTYYKTTGYVAASSGTATAISVAVYDWADADGSQFRVGLYDSSKNLLAYGTISGTAGGFISGALNTSVSITSGATYYVAVMATFGTGYPYTAGTYQSSVASASGYPTLPNPLGFVAEVATGSIGLAVTGTISAPQTITDINSGNPVSGDTSGNTFTTTGFTESITDVEVGGLACTSVVETSGSGTFTVPPPVDGEVYPELGVNQDVVISGATESATLAKSFVLTGYTVTTLTDPELVDTTYFTANFDVTPLTNDLMITVTDDVTPTADGGGTTDNPKTTTVLHWKRSTGVMYIYSFRINEAGVDNRGLTAVGMTAIGLTQTGLTAVGL